MGSYKIVKNKRTKGYSCYFVHQGNWYYADLSYCSDVRENEMMIFRANEKKEVISWSDLYCKYFDEVSKENLIEGIEDFKSKINQNE